MAGIQAERWAWLYELGKAMAMFSVGLFVFSTTLALVFALWAWVLFLFRPRVIANETYFPPLLAWRRYPALPAPVVTQQATSPIVDREPDDNQAWRAFYVRALLIAEACGGLDYRSMAECFAYPLAEAGIFETIRQGSLTKYASGWDLERARAEIVDGLTPPYPAGSPPEVVFYAANSEESNSETAVIEG